MQTLVSMESSHLVIFSTSGNFITGFNVLRCISLGETLIWTGVRGRIPITLGLRFRGPIYRPSSFVLMLHCCANLRAMRYGSTGLNGVVGGKSHRVEVA